MSARSPPSAAAGAAPVTVKKPGAHENVPPNAAVVRVEPRPKKGVLAWKLDTAEKAALWLSAGGSSPPPLQYVSGIFAPVDEMPPRHDLPVRGQLPECLNGQFFRIGSNPKFAPISGYHWFDGDGMIHALRIKDGKATYASRYVRTSRLKQEEYFGEAKFVKLADIKGFVGLLVSLLYVLRTKLGVLDVSYGTGTGNTAFVYHNGRLMALHERDKPYVIKVMEDGDIQTLGFLDYGKRLTHAFTAHPKVDPLTGEMFTFGYGTDPPYVTYRVVTKDGQMLDPVPITIPQPIMMHDFCITENYAVFMDHPMYYRPEDILRDKLIYSFDSTKKACFGVLPRYAKDDKNIKWFELPNCYIFHNANAWEEGDEVVLISCRIENANLEIFSGPVRGRVKKLHDELYEMRFNMKTGVASQKKLSVPTVEFPKINESYTGRKQRYVYCSIFDAVDELTGVAKFDLQAEPASGKKELEDGGNIRGIYRLGPGRYGSEAVFVPRQPGTSGEEDDGYLIFFMQDQNTGKSEVHVVDARTMSPDPVAVVELPRRVPSGFHAIFLREEELERAKQV